MAQHGRQRESGKERPEAEDARRGSPFAGWTLLGAPFAAMLSVLWLQRWKADLESYEYFDAGCTAFLIECVRLVGGRRPWLLTAHAATVAVILAGREDSRYDFAVNALFALSLPAFWAVFVKTQLGPEEHFPLAGAWTRQVNGLRERVRAFVVRRRIERLRRTRRDEPAA